MDATEAYYFARSTGAGSSLGHSYGLGYRKWDSNHDYMSDTCTDLNSQNRIMLEVTKAGTEGVPVDLPTHLKEHLNTCAYCASGFPNWVTACAGMKRVKEETDLMERAALGDPSILRRQVKEGTALFRPPKSEDERGLMVIVGDRSPYDARRVRRLTRAEFDAYE